MEFSPAEELLSYEEITRLVKIFLGYGVSILRLTGGEPLVRPDLPLLISEIKGIGGSTKPLRVNITTNGSLLGRYLEDLEMAGLDSMNISLDTLKAEKFRLITKRDQFQTVLSNIHKARASKIKTKVNCVVLRGFNDKELVDFVEFATKHEITVRFIEFMPFNGNKWLSSSFMSSDEMRQIIGREYKLFPLPVNNRSQTSRLYGIEGQKGKIGFISSVSQTFCQWCDRVRLTAEGSLRTCLHGTDETDLKVLMRSGASDREIDSIIRAAVFAKQKGHIDWIDPGIIWSIPLEDREMIRIGG